MKQNGFTLVELAIALMVIGLLIGGVLKGQELIENARITRMVKDLNSYDAAVMIFRNSYDDLPGDTRRPNRIPNCTEAPCNNVLNVGNNQIAEANNTADPATAIKSKNFWVHMERAGLITGNDEEEFFNKVRPMNVFEGWIVASYTATGNPDLTDEQPLNSLNLREPATATQYDRYFAPKRAAALDQKMDDGKPLSGMFLAARSVTTGSHGTSGPLTTCIDENEDYLNVDASTGRCLILVRLGSLN